MSRPLRKVLIANRGEIAVRVARGLRERGIGSVAVYSEPDRTSLHVIHADEAYLIGPGPARESYLDIGRILDAAARSGADAVHPGYGFLAENAEFAEACRRASLTFIGPPPEVIRAMGDKVAARRRMAAAGVEAVPGSGAALASVEEARRAADAMGYPVLIKASAGGGGKGMRRVASPEELPSAFAQAQGEAASAFGDATVYLEKLLVAPRHVEVQVMADEHGHVIHLGERDCSIQRRHQKVIEECPSPAVDDHLRTALTSVAVKAAQAVGYVGAGTVEFLLDRDGRFYFLEMNTRLQVEHPVTELVTGTDLVALQLQVASGERLPLGQEEVRMRGAAIECRVCAEDPENGFLPSPGRIVSLRAPGGPGVREDTGIYEGYEVPDLYDPLLSKVCAYGSDRAMALARMARAVQEYRIAGIKTNLAFHERVLRSPAFRSGRYDTGFLDTVFLAEDEGRVRPHEDVAVIAAALHALSRGSKGAAAASAEDPWIVAARHDGLRRPS